ncbi:MAG TPA: hypothetical protein VL053_12610 [Arachidicoccus sp.]|nr:hypothetical protein [Arachidicoccus sp.]
MPEMTQAEFDQLVDHSIRIELMDGFTLIYPISVESKTAFYRNLNNDDYIDGGEDLSFTWFYLPSDRLVLVNNNDIIKIIFCTDKRSGEAPTYHDNFGIMERSEPDYDIDGSDSEDGGAALILPQLIILDRRPMEDSELVKAIAMKTDGCFGNISSYSSLDAGDVEGVEFEYDTVEDFWSLEVYKYLQFNDDDGEANFMPLRNLSVIELERPLLMSDEDLDMYLERK